MEIFFDNFVRSIQNFYIFIKKEDIDLSLYNIFELEKHMEDYAKELINYRTAYYHNSIFLTNIRRWNKLTNKNNKILILFCIFMLDINYFDFEKLNDYSILIRYAFENKKPNILEKLKLVESIENFNLLNSIRKVYPNIIFNDNINLKKLVKINNFF